MKVVDRLNLLTVIFSLNSSSRLVSSSENPGSSGRVQSEEFSRENSKTRPDLSRPIEVTHQHKSKPEFRAQKHMQSLGEL